MSMASMTLRGKKVLVTRARDQGEKTASLIEARGGEAVLLPTIAIAPPADPGAVARAVGRVREFAWVAFTSANGVEWGWRAGLDAAVLADVKVAAIGPGTAKALAARGREADLVATDSKGEGLASAMLASMDAAESVMLLRAKVARDVFPDALRAAGHPVEVVAVYETRPASGDDVDRALAALAGGRIDAATFTSASTVDGFVELVGGAVKARDLLRRAITASIGPITSEALARQGLRIDCVAAEATLAGLLDALEKRLPLGPSV
jgi:uroporphyrinogen III methyltransferase/synthase